MAEPVPQSKRSKRSATPHLDIARARAARAGRSAWVALATILGAACVALTAPGCKRGDTVEKEGADGGASTEMTAADLATAETNAVNADAGTLSVPLIAFTPLAPIFNVPDFPGKGPDDKSAVVRLGYIRKGERVEVKPKPVKKANCPDGWYELAGAVRGFVCGKYATTDENHKELKFSPHAAYMDRSLPYDYGLNLTPGTPLYRRLPLKRERREYEKTLAIGKGAKTSDIAKKLKESGEEVPAYLKDTGNPKPSVAFDDLKGESNLVALRMLKGFYVSLDRKVDGRSGMFWHTVSGFMAPQDHLIVHEAKTEFEGVVLDGAPAAAGEDKRRLPFAFVVGTRGRTHRVVGTDVKRGDRLPRFSIYNLTGKREVVEDRVYYETADGFFLRDIDIAVVDAPKVPTDIAPNEKWIDVDLSSQALVAFEGEKPVYATIVSTGRHSTDPAKDYRTTEGSFRIREKHIATTMDDDGASDGTYRIEDVPWVMYFEKSLALHGAFWHSGFGRERSHGCVNLTPHDARHLFMWAGPALPEGWHGVKATKENPGTRVVVHP